MSAPLEFDPSISNVIAGPQVPAIHAVNNPLHRRGGGFTAWVAGTGPVKTS